MDRRFDPEHIAGLATKVGKLSDGYSQVSTDLGDGDPGGAYGGLSNAARSGETTRHFYSAVNSQMEAAGRLVDAASQALADAAERMRNDEDQGVHTFSGAPDRADRA